MTSIFSVAFRFQSLAAALVALAMVAMCGLCACGQVEVIKRAEVDACCQCLAERHTLVAAFGANGQRREMADCLIAQFETADDKGLVSTDGHDFAADHCTDNIMSGADVPVQPSCMQNECGQQCWFMPYDRDG